MTLQELFLILPELVLAGSACALLMIGVFRRDIAVSSVFVLTMAILGLALGLILVSSRMTGIAFGGLFLVDQFGDYMKVLILIGGMTTLLLSLRYIEREGMARFEFPLLMLFAVLGMLMMVSANDLMSLYVGLELQSLSLYLVAAFRHDNLRATEAGLKYFVLGALSSGMLLYGSSLIYGFTGSTSFTTLATQFEGLAQGGHGPGVAVVVGLVFILAGLAFKISAVPFHMWTPDVYEGAPTPVTAFFATAPKMAAMALLIRVVTGPFGELTAQWQQVIVLIAIASMVLGAFAAIAQTNIKRLMAYSSIGHMGYALVGLAAGTEAGVTGLMVYVAIYLVMNLGTFACILSMKRQDVMYENIEDLKGLSRTDPLMAFVLAAMMFSMAGIPPLAGFVGKFLVFKAAIEAELYTLAIVGVLASVVGSFYYLRICKYMYFDAPTDSFDKPKGREMSLVLGASAILVILFLVFVAPVYNSASAAAAALLAG